MRLALGTAQLGLPYGIANRSGKPDAAEAARIVGTAYDAGIRWFDTAQAYGDSEAVLGRALRELGLTDRIRVVSKLHPDVAADDPQLVAAAVRDSLGRLGRDCLDGFLLHREEMLAAFTGRTGAGLRELRERGLVRRLGVSCYSTGAAHKALGSDLVDILQLPGSVFDRRLLRDGIVAEAGKGRCTLFVRSVFLQGLALMAADEVPPDIPRAREALGAFAEFCRSHRVDRKTFCIRYALERFAPGILIVGAERATQVTETAALAGDRPLPSELFDEWDRVWPEDVEGLIDPSRWPKTRT